ncbi:MAG: ATP-binding protein [Candidatus Omnitrophica bacterium]|nr:ATP-binding protein [Candidatus Omnitrophota bacterium]
MFTDPVTGNNFYDREEYLDILLKRAKGLEKGYRQNIALLGEETIGKTSLILHFLSKIKEDSFRVLPFYLEIDTELTFDYFVKRLISIILFNIIKLNHKTAPSHNIDELLKHSEDLIPKTIQEVKKCLVHLKNSKFYDAYITILTVPQSLSQELGIPVIVIIEEFHRLERFTILHNPFNELAKTIMVSKDTMYIVTSSSTTHAKKILSKELTLLFGNFEIIKLEPFDIKTSNNFLEKRLESIKCSAYYRDFISEITGGQPLYLNIISEETKITAIEKKSNFITDEILIEAITRILFDSMGILNQIFSHRIKEIPTNRSPLSYTSILISLAHKCYKTRNLKEFLDTKSEKEFINHLNTLIEMNYIDKNGVFYYLNDELFRIWLTEVYESKRSSLDVGLEVKRECFKRYLREKLNSFLKNRRKSIVERLHELFENFGNETVYFGSRKIKLPNFDNIEIKNAHSRLPILTGKTRDKSWIFVVSKGHLNRDLMEEIDCQCNKLKLKKERKFVIALDSVDEDARLIAKETKFITLENRDLDRILKLYGKYRIFY